MGFNDIETIEKDLDGVEEVIDKYEKHLSKEFLSV